ncbi:dolichol-phosphate mannosyltransferase [Actinorhabdospora filicis]|uniref:Dolichol-phosphate mannosyltransferase n=1 Tax=Actinorhabdospora filicis TaxID=1785913 RepID=A0A9W6SPZ6_9ACTN|nr:polyprenol monophosphomannose synthase [Actinorhabdospora filicis]GLZ80007.1 dolichol-phosphate mannosyltransferase [Actinorhabdospora filicis]
MTASLVESPRASARELPADWAATPIAVVVPTYNESGNLPTLVERVFALGLPNLRLIIVDDNSPDGTGRLADELAEARNAEREGAMVVVHREVKDGIGRAHMTGMREAMSRGDEYVVQMDGDLSHPPEIIPQMLGTMRATGAGLVIGSRYIPGGSVSENWNLYRRSLSRGASIYVNAILRTRIRDTTGGFKLWHASALESIDLDKVRSTGFSFQIEMNHRAFKAGVKILEIPIHFDERLTGVSKITMKIQLEGLWVPWRLLTAKK